MDIQWKIAVHEKTKSKSEYALFTAGSGGFLASRTANDLSGMVNAMVNPVRQKPIAIAAYVRYVVQYSPNFSVRKKVVPKNIVYRPAAMEIATSNPIRILHRRGRTSEPMKYLHG